MSSGDGGPRRRRRWRPNPDTALALAALVLAAGGGGYALGAGTGDQVITACFDPASGSVPQKIIAGADCGPGQTALSWNQIGTQGPLGPAGSQGPAGPAGAAGSVGAPATGNQAIVAAPSGPTGDPGQPGGFVVNLELPSAGTYELVGSVAYYGFNGIVGCRITRDRPAQVIDTLVEPVSPVNAYAGPTSTPKLTQIDVRALHEHALITVAAAAPSDPAITTPAKVKVAFSCNAPPAFYKRRGTKRGQTTSFIRPRLSATPVTLTTIQKVK